MQDHATDAGVFIRSMATRGHLGGVAWATPQALRVLDGAGCDVVLLETVGVGQAEVEVATLADSTVVLLAPGMGDGIQAAKAGILEVADVFAVNKADRDGADATVRDLRGMIALGERDRRRDADTPSRWQPPVVKTVAMRSEGIDDLVEALDRHRAWMAEHGELDRRRHERACREVEAIAVAALRARLGDLGGRGSLEALGGKVAAGATDPYTAADLLLEQVTDS
jgi:LAO/AO transport system kinase